MQSTISENGWKENRVAVHVQLNSKAWSDVKKGGSMGLRESIVYPLFFCDYNLETLPVFTNNVAIYQFLQQRNGPTDLLKLDVDEPSQQPVALNKLSSTILIRLKPRYVCWHVPWRRASTKNSAVFTTTSAYISMCRKWTQWNVLCF